MTSNNIAKNIKLYHWSMVFAEPLFWGPIIILYLQHLGHMSLSEIYFMEAAVLLGFIFLEIPSGALADLIGTKKTMFIGSVLHALGAIGFVFITTATSAWIVNMIFMIGSSLKSGADSAFLFDSLKAIGKEADYKKVQGKAFGNRMLFMAFASLAAGFLAEIDLRLPAILSVPGMIASCALIVFFIEPKITEKYRFKKQLDLMKISILFVANHKAVKWIVLFSTLIGVASKIWFFTYNPYFELVDLELKYYGMLFFLFNLVAWYFSRYAYRIEKRISEGWSIVLMVLFIGAPMLLMGSFVTTLSISMILFQNAIRGFMEPFFGGFLNRHLDSKNRATVISIKSAVLNFVQFIGLSTFGVMLKVWTLPTCLQMVGVATLVLGAYGIYTYRKIFPQA